MREVKRIDIKDFRSEGYLQEVNRCFFHPLGMALEVVVEEDGLESLGGVWDYRDDPEGIYYGPQTGRQDNAQKVQTELAIKKSQRQQLFGWTDGIQPIEDL